MYRPIEGVEQNRLDLLLFAPELVPDPDVDEEERKRILKMFNANGARAVRDILRDLTEKHPPFAPPTAKAGRRGQQDNFAKLYDMLRIVTDGS